MACWSSPESSRGGQPGKIVGPRTFEEPEGGYGTFRLDEVFEVLNSKKKFNAIDISFGGTHPYVARTAQNNGIKGYVNLDTKYLNEANTISFGQDTATAFFQPDPYFTGDKIKVLKFRYGLLKPSIAIYLLTAIRKAFSLFSWGTSSFSDEVIRNVTFDLPLKRKEVSEPNEIDFEFMESRIRELEESRIRELEAYLSEAGFENCDLSQSEAEVLSLFENGKIKWKRFKMETLYDKLKLKNKAFDKRRDTSSTPTAKFSIPLVNAKHGDNGIMFYGNADIFDSSEMTIDIVQNGAIATGNVYAQPQRTGVLWDAYLIKARIHHDTENSLLFMACTIQKTIKSIFSYDKKATWNRVKHESIQLPVNLSGEIDYSLIETFVSAIKKKAIQSLKKFTAQEHQAYTFVVKN